MSQWHCACKTLLKQFVKRCCTADRKMATTKSTNATRGSKTDALAEDESGSQNASDSLKEQEKRKSDETVSCDSAAKKEIVAKVATELVASAHESVEVANTSVEAATGEVAARYSESSEANGESSSSSSSSSDNFGQLVDMLTALVMKDAIDEVRQTIRNTDFENVRKLEALVKFGEETASHVIRDVMKSMRDEYVQRGRIDDVEETENTELRCPEVELECPGDEARARASSSPAPSGAAKDLDLCDVIVEECSDSSRSSSSSSSDDDSSSSSSEDEDRNVSEESSDELDGAKGSSCIEALFRGSLKIEDKVAEQKPAAVDAAVKSAVASEAANPFDQYFEPVCRRCRELRALLLEVEEDIDSDAMRFHFTKEQLGDKTGPPVVCSLCMKDGHYKDACPDEVLPGKRIQN